jgi:hypothetical protein
MAEVAAISSYSISYITGFMRWCLELITVLSIQYLRANTSKRGMSGTSHRLYFYLICRYPYVGISCVTELIVFTSILVLDEIGRVAPK